VEHRPNLKSGGNLFARLSLARSLKSINIPMPGFSDRDRGNDYYTENTIGEGVMNVLN
jgi:hypothetical protein